MKFDAIRRRVTGISTPIFGISWDPSTTDREVARRLVTFLEDRRVLFSPFELEVPSHCVHSVVDIRHYLTSALQEDPGTELAGGLRAMRAACRKFLDRSGHLLSRGEHLELGGFHGWVFISALGELRGVMGLHLAKLAVQYGLDVEDDLAAILPEEVEE